MNPINFIKPFISFLLDHNAIFIITLLGVLILIWDLIFAKSQNRQKIGIIIIGVTLIGWLDIGSLILLFIVSFIVLLIARYKIPIKKKLYPIVFLLLILLIFIKDYSLLFEHTAAWVPLGVSYYFFRLISFLIEYANNKPGYQDFSILDYYAWIFFFPTFLAGPILRFHEFKVVETEKTDINKVACFSWFFGALILKLIFVDYFLYQHAYNILLPALKTNSLSFAPVFLIIFGWLAFLHAYFDLMLYTEMSKSLAGYLGFTNVDNFNKPLLASNISQFWQRWHMSLSNWTRDYVFFPTLVKSRKTWIASYASMLTIGLWHSISLNWIIWALLHGTALNGYNKLRASSFYTYMIGTNYGRLFLRFTGSFITLMFVAIIFIFVAFHDLRTPVNLFLSCLKLGTI